jgi:hypothetical protein
MVAIEDALNCACDHSSSVLQMGRHRSDHRAYMRPTESATHSPPAEQEQDQQEAGPARPQMEHAHRQAIVAPQRRSLGASFHSSQSSICSNKDTPLRSPASQRCVTTGFEPCERGWRAPEAPRACARKSVAGAQLEVT